MIWASLAFAADCLALETPGETLQVAWVSTLGRTVGAHSGIEVVRVSELRQLVEARGRNDVAILRALGLLGARAQLRQDYKVTVFDVDRDWLCRPMDQDEGTTVAGMAVCPAEWQGPGPGTKRRAYTGCGYLADTDTGERTLDVWRLTWENAVSRGFCVLPLARFLGGA